MRMQWLSPLRSPSYRHPPEHPIYVSGFHGFQLNGVPMKTDAVNPAFAVGHGKAFILSRSNPQIESYAPAGLTFGGVDFDGEEI